MIYDTPTQRIANTASTVGSAVLTLIGFLLFIAGAFSGVVSGIWLAVLGEWGVIVAGILFSVAMPYAFGLVLLPSLGFIVLMLKVSRGNRLLIGISGLVAGLYNHAAIGIWVLFVYLLITKNIGSENHVPYLLWGYSVVMGPLAYMARHDPPDSTANTLGLLLAVLSYLVLVILHYSVGSLVVSIIGVAAMIMVFSLVTAFLASAVAREEQELAFAEEAFRANNEDDLEEAEE